jgi:hypothetical protein
MTLTSYFGGSAVDISEQREFSLVEPDKRQSAVGSLSVGREFSRIEQVSEPKVGDLLNERIEVAFSGSRLDTQSPNAPHLRKADGSNTAIMPMRSNPRGLKLVARQPQNRLAGFVVEQRWQGYVVSMTEDKFFAKVYDTSPEAEDEIEQVEFDKDEVALLMRPLVTPGAIFYWDIGFQVDASGQRIRQSIISFPMIPTDTREQLEAAAARADSLYKKLGWDQGEHSTQQQGGTNS